MKLSRDPAGNSLLFAALALAVLSLIAAQVLSTVITRFQSSRQTGGWHGARLAAEAGIDIALKSLNANAPDPSAAGANWSGWKHDTGNGTSVAATGTVLAKSNCTVSSAGNPLLISDVIYLDNTTLISNGVENAQTNVQVQALFPIPDRPDYRWYRIRSMGTASLGQMRRAIPDPTENRLRRTSLVSVRSQLLLSDPGVPVSIPTPNVSRVVEVIARPVLPFSMAILTDEDMTLGQSSNWLVDSWDSRDPSKSNADGTYPGANSPKAQDNGSIGSNKERPANSPYGALIDANGAVVRGDASTNGGDNPNTTTHENISGNQGIDQDRIFHDFYQELEPISRPSMLIQSNPGSGQPFTAGTSGPLAYLISGNLGPFTVSAPPAGTTGEIVIMVNGDINIGNGNSAKIVIPPNVKATIYVKGDVDFGNGDVNVNNGSSGLPGNLLIFGEPSNGQTRSLGSAGNPNIAAAIYAPDYDVNLKGTANFYGAVVCKTFKINGGGNGGFHYDEALSELGVPSSFKIASFIEDARQ